MNRNHLDPIDYAANVLSTDSYAVRMDKRAEYEKRHPVVIIQGSDSANAFVARVVVAVLLCMMFFLSLYKPLVDPLMPNAGIFVLAAVCLYFIVLAFRSLGIATLVLVVGFLGIGAAAFALSLHGETAKGEAASLQKKHALVPLTACGTYFKALALHQKEGERLNERKCLLEESAERSKIQASHAHP